MKDFGSTCLGALYSIFYNFQSLLKRFGHLVTRRFTSSLQWVLNRKTKFGECSLYKLLISTIDSYCFSKGVDISKVKNYMVCLMKSRIVMHFK